MTYTNKTTLALALAVGAFGATGLFAGNGDTDQLKLQLKDGSCQALYDETVAADPTASEDQILLRLRLRDGSCLLDSTDTEEPTDDEAVAGPQQVRTRTGEDNGAGEVVRHRNEGGDKAQSGGGKN